MYRLIVIGAILLSMTACAYVSHASSGIDPRASASGALVNPLPADSSESRILQGTETATPSPTSASPAPTSVPTATPVRDTATLQELLQRLVGYSYPGAPSPEAQIYVGQLPDKMPVGIPLPDGSRVIGSVTRGDENLQIVLDAPQTPDDAISFYRQRMVAAGWSATDQTSAPSGGFVPSGIPNGVTLCQSREGPSLFVNASAEPNEPTDVRLNLNTKKNQQYPCSQPLGVGPGPVQLIPRLVAPDGARQTDGGSGSSSAGSSYNTATLVTDQNAAALASFYGNQLAQAGWIKQEEGQSASVAWSTWNLTDKAGTSWKGLFFALELPGPPTRRFVYVRVDMP